MEMTTLGTITKEEVDKVIIEYIENKIGKKVISVKPNIESKENELDWNASLPLDYVLTGYTFYLKEEN